MEIRRLKDNFAHVAAHGDAVPSFFYADLFLRHPQVRGMFPVTMDAQRDRLVRALGRIVSDVDNLEALVPFLRGLGRDHRKFGALADHYGAVGTSLIATLRYFSGPDWSKDLEEDWTAAYSLAAKAMIEAASDDERTYPAWWDARVVRHELRSPDTAVFSVVTDEPLPYLPGQSVCVETSKVPRTWRLYSMANAPRDDLTLDFHVRTLEGGLVSPLLTYGIGVGSRLRLGPAVGEFRLAPTPGRDLLLVGGGTGLAPLKAIVEQVADFRDPPRVRLFHGARSAEGLYDLTDLEKMAARWPWLTVTTAVSEDQNYQGEHGLISDVVARHGAWDRHEAYVAGPSAMVAATVGRLTSAGVPGEHIHVEDLAWSAP
jgi:NAD(P)H-flavin reductase